MALDLKPKTVMVELPLMVIIPVVIKAVTICSKIHLSLLGQSGCGMRPSAQSASPQRGGIHRLELSPTGTAARHSHTYTGPKLRHLPDQSGEPGLMTGGLCSIHKALFRESWSLRLNSKEEQLDSMALLWISYIMGWHSIRKNCGTHWEARQLEGC